MPVWKMVLQLVLKPVLRGKIQLLWVLILSRLKRILSPWVTQQLSEKLSIWQKVISTLTVLMPSMDHSFMLLVSQ